MNHNVGIIAPTLVHSIAFTGTATTPTDISFGGSGVQQYIMVAETGDCWVIFGSSSDMSVATSASWPLFNGQPYAFQIGRPQKYLSVIRQGTTSGTLKIYLPGEAE